MAKRRYTPEQIINNLREADEGRLLEPASRRGKMVMKVGKSLGVSLKGGPVRF